MIREEVDTKGAQCKAVCEETPCEKCNHGRASQWIKHTYLYIQQATSPFKAKVDSCSL